MRQLSCKLAAAVILATLPTVALYAEEPAPQKPGYMIVVGEGVDPAKMGAYAGAAVPLLLKAGGELLFVTDEGQTEVIEGAAFPGSVRVLRFPSLQAARDFYYSEEYRPPSRCARVTARCR